MKRYLITICLAALLILLMGACSTADRNNEDISVDTVIESESIPVSEDIQAQAVFPEETVSEEMDVAKNEMYTPMTFSSISDMIRQGDLNDSNQSNMNYPVDKDLYDKALAAYDREIGTLTAECICKMNGVGTMDQLRYSFGYIDYDSIPEVFICCDNSGICGVHIFAYDANEDKVVWIGEYGTRGILRYAEGKGRVIAQYGNGGFFTDNYIDVSSYTEPEVIGRTAVFSSENGDIYYARLPFSEDSDGSNNSPRQSNLGGIPLDSEDDFSSHDVAYVVGSDEYQSIVTVLLNFAAQESVKKVYIDEMDIVTLNEGGMQLLWKEY